MTTCHLMYENYATMQLTERIYCIPNIYMSNCLIHYRKVQKSQSYRGYQRIGYMVSTMVERDNFQRIMLIDFRIISKYSLNILYKLNVLTVYCCVLEIFILQTLFRIINCIFIN